LNVVDANIVLKLYLTEPDSDAAQEVVTAPARSPRRIISSARLERCW
jgi:hypothetical protein